MPRSLQTSDTLELNDLRIEYIPDCARKYKKHSRCKKHNSIYATSIPLWIFLGKAYSSSDSPYILNNHWSDYIVLFDIKNMKI